MDQVQEIIDCRYELGFGDSLYEEKIKCIVFLIQSKFYKIYVPHYLMTIKEIIKILSQKLYETHQITLLGIDKYLDSKDNQLQESEIIKNFIHKIEYIQVIEFKKGEKYLSYDHLFDNQIEIILKNQLQPHELLSLRTILQCRDLGSVQPFLAYPQKNALNKINILFVGPANTPYQDGLFELQFIFSLKNIYRPQIQLVTPIYHPNIYKGQIALDVEFQETQLGVKFHQAIFSIIYLLGHPNFEKVLDKECANLYQQNQDSYYQQASSITLKYANPQIYEQTDLDVLQIDNQYQQLNEKIQFLLKLSKSYFDSKKWKDIELELENEIHLIKYDFEIQYFEQSNGFLYSIQENDFEQILNDQNKQNQAQNQNKQLVKKYQTSMIDFQRYKIQQKEEIEKKFYIVYKSNVKQPLNNRIKLSRIIRELKECPISDQKEMFKIFPDQELNSVKVFFLGPKLSPYDGGLYQLLIKFPPDYPQKPLHCVLQTKIYHPNIKDNYISLNRLKLDQWCPILTLRTIILSIISLLDDPNPEDPLDYECAQLYKTNRDSYNQKVEEFKFKYAQPKINQLIEETFGQNFRDEEQINKLLIDWLKYWENFNI